MTDIRPRRVLFFAIVLATPLAVAGHLLLSDRNHDPYPDEAEDLAELAADRFENGRGLSPCDRGSHELVFAALDRLVVLGEPAPDLIVVIAPTFSEIEMVVLTSSHVRSYRFPGQTGFTMPSSEWFRPTPELISETALAPPDYFRLYSPIARHITYAMTTQQLGLDGTSYYFGRGRSDCAVAWSPRTGPAGLISQILAEASKPAPSRDSLIELAREIDRVDSVR